jgi:hypothetical protein
MCSGVESVLDWSELDVAWRHRGDSVIVAASRAQPQTFTDAQDIRLLCGQLLSLPVKLVRSNRDTVPMPPCLSVHYLVAHDQRGKSSVASKQQTEEPAHTDSEAEIITAIANVKPQGHLSFVSVSRWLCYNLSLLKRLYEGTLTITSGTWLVLPRYLLS